MFGEVIKGMEVVRTIERTRVNSNDRPLSPVVIADCGELKDEPVGVVCVESFHRKRRRSPRRLWSKRVRKYLVIEKKPRREREVVADLLIVSNSFLDSLFV